MKTFFSAAALVVFACPAWGQEFLVDSTLAWSNYINGVDTTTGGGLVVAVADFPDQENGGLRFLSPKPDGGWRQTSVWQSPYINGWGSVATRGDTLWGLFYLGGSRMVLAAFFLSTRERIYEREFNYGWAQIQVLKKDQQGGVWWGKPGGFYSLTSSDYLGVVEPVDIEWSPTAGLVGVGRTEVRWRRPGSVPGQEEFYYLLDQDKFPTVTSAAVLHSVTVDSLPIITLLGGGGTAAPVLRFKTNPPSSTWEELYDGEGNRVEGVDAEYVEHEGLYVLRPEGVKLFSGTRVFSLPFRARDVFVRAGRKFFVSRQLEGDPPQLYIVEGFVTPVRGALNAPADFWLAQNYPNPFNPTTTIRFNLARPSQVTLTIFDLLGRQVDVLASGWRPAGKHQVTWDGHDDAGAIVASGIYFYRLEANGLIQTRKLTLLH